MEKSGIGAELGVSVRRSASPPRTRWAGAGARLTAGLRLGCVLPCAAALAGCAGDFSGLGDHLPSYVVVQTTPRTTLQRALADCPDKTVGKERECVTKALAEAGLTVPQLVSEIHGCQIGRMCEYRYTTVDRLGFIPSTAADFKVRWLVSLDFRRAPASVAQVPVTVSVAGT